MLLSLTLISNVSAAVEDGSAECSDGIDNDFDALPIALRRRASVHLRRAGS
jgi:hypothetical protein